PPPCLWPRRFRKSNIFRRRSQKPSTLFLRQRAPKTRRLSLSGAPRPRRSRLAGPFASRLRNLDRQLPDRFAATCADLFLRQADRSPLCHRRFRLERGARAPTKNGSNVSFLADCRRLGNAHFIEHVGLMRGGRSQIQTLIQWRKCPVMSADELHANCKVRQSAT